MYPLGLLGDKKVTPISPNIFSGSVGAGPIKSLRMRAPEWLKPFLARLSIAPGMLILSSVQFITLFSLLKAGDRIAVCLSAPRI